MRECSTELLPDMLLYSRISIGWEEGNSVLKLRRRPFLSCLSDELWRISKPILFQYAGIFQEKELKHMVLYCAGLKSNQNS